MHDPRQDESPFPAGEWDVVVVGAGPAGSIAACDLARAGARVAVIERAMPPRYKTCGGGVVHRALEMLPAPVDGVVERVCHSATMSFHETGLSFSVSRDVPLVTMTMRALFDNALLQSAREAGAAVFAGREVRSVETAPGRVRVVFEGGNLTARFVIAADGALSPVARSAGWREPPAAIPAIEWEVPVPPDVLARFETTARFDFDIVPHGYAWIFPKRDHVSVGALTTRRARLDLASILERYLDMRGVRVSGPIERHGFVIPVAPRREGFALNRVLLAGDAAGLADPITCEGISLSMRSGKIAAAALVEGRFEEAPVRQAYVGTLERVILADLKLARVLARFLYRPGRVREALFRRYGQEMAEAMTDVIVGTRSYRDLFLSHNRYLKMLFGTRRPA